VKGFLVVNPRSGSGDESEAVELQAEARRRGVQAHLLSPGDDPETLMREADADALGVAGGDGSMAGGAAVAIGRGLRSSAFRSGRGTTSPATSAWSPRIRWPPSTHSTVWSAASTSAAPTGACS